jgi:hypothetical protein
MYYFKCKKCGKFTTCKATCSLSMEFPKPCTCDTCYNIGMSHCDCNTRYLSDNELVATEL